MTRLLLITAAAAFAASAGVSRFNPHNDFLTWSLAIIGAVLIGAAIASIDHSRGGETDESDTPDR
jgi:hypothetical protein